jgi:pimeloyl-ACP methyl ester carboxylesterase
MPLATIPLASVTADGPDTIELDYESFGQVGDPAVLLIMGLGTQRTAWPQSLIDHLVGLGFRVISFDNRDIGLSTQLTHLGLPNMPWNLTKATIGLPVHAPYSLEDMAQDALHLLDHLHIARAHIVGASMGGMIAQLLAILAPQRVSSLTSIMSTTGRRSLPGPSAQAKRAMLSKPGAKASVEQIARHMTGIYKVIGSPDPALADTDRYTQMLAAVNRSYHPAGVARHLLAILANGSRVERLQRLKLPTLVIHGQVDQLVPIECGRDTADTIPGAHMVSIKGMGHDFAPTPLKLLTPALGRFLLAQSHAPAH